jgi:hypothetical protein
MMQLYSALYTISGGGVLNDIQYTIFQIKINVTRDTYSHVYNIVNYPLLPIFTGILYNIYCMIKNRKIKATVN